jgi:hypothetical protein
VLAGQAEIDEIARHGDVARVLRSHVGDDGVQHIAVVDMPAVAIPVGRPQRPLDIELPQRQPRHRRQMHVGQMGEQERIG